MPVYFLLNDGDGPWRIKIGRAKDIESRRKQLQTGNPEQLKLVGEIRTEKASQLEAALHRQFKDKRVDPKLEWFYIQPADVWPVLERHRPVAFVGVSGNAYEITGYDNDGIPEYAGVWEWGQFDLDELCPFCGWLGGMHFQEASWMYHCVECDTLTNFEEDRDDEPPDGYQDRPA